VRWKFNIGITPQKR